jgi:hypothetical protein
MVLRALVAFAASLLVVGCLTGQVFAAPFGLINVPGTSDPWLAGMPDGSTASAGDTAPTHSPVLVPGLSLSGGSTITFVVTGAVLNDPGCCAPGANPDGSGFTGHATGAENGIASATVPLNSLMGVFLGSAQPDLSAAPSALDFSAIGLSFTSLSPGLKQPFFIGDGLTGTGSGTAQSFIVPNDATRLFLGSMDGFGWFNNSGQFAVSGDVSGDLAPVPEPATLLLLATTAAGFGLARWRRKA